jgi:hypothetical protein
VKETELEKGRDEPGKGKGRTWKKAVSVLVRWDFEIRTE